MSKDELDAANESADKENKKMIRDIIDQRLVFLLMTN